VQSRTTTNITEVIPERRSWGERVRGRRWGDYEEDGVFRPVRLPLWIDLGVSALIVLAVAAIFVGFFVWLAQTQAR
jgi:hypothetical protein